jgi:LPXTG-motif cell wall-anchored protein
VTLVDGETRMVADLPVGTECTLDEVTKPDTSGPSYVYGPEVFTPSNLVTVGSTSTVAVTLENPIERLLGAIAVTKQVTGETEGYVEDSEFGFTLDCSDDDFDESFTLTAGETATFDEIPLGTTCTVTEVSVPDPVEGYEYQSPVLTPDDGTVTVESTTETVTVTVANPLVSVPPTTPTPTTAPSGQSPAVDVLDTTQTRGTLPTTGSNVVGMVVLAAGLVLAGASLIGISRRRS